MGADPPYLLRDGHDAYVTVINDIKTEVQEIAVRGRWSRRLCLDIYSVLRKCIVEHPSAIIVDLHELSDLDAQSAPMWMAAARASTLVQPHVQLVLAMPPTRQLAHRLRRLGATRTLPIFVSVEKARAAVAGGVRLADRLQLRWPDAVSVTAAADLVGVGCKAWGMESLTEPAQQVMAALVANACEHGGADMIVTVCRRTSGVYLSVRDGDSRIPRLYEQGDGPGAEPDQERQRLRLVDAQAFAWGARPGKTGKVVWALLRTAAPTP